MNRFHLKILAAERMFFDGPCESLIVPTVDGLYGIQAEHQDVVIAVVPGKLTIHSAGGAETVAAVSGGVLKMENNKALLLADCVERPEEIDLRRAEREAAEAREALLQNRSVQESHQAEERMVRALNRIKIKRRKK